jgi:hypothetical protein
MPIPSTVAKPVNETERYSIRLTPVAPTTERLKHYMSERGSKFFGWAALTIATGFFAGKAIALCLGLFAFFHERAAINRPKQ